MVRWRLAREIAGKLPKMVMGRLRWEILGRGDKLAGSSRFGPDLECILSYNKYGRYCIPESSIHRPAAQKIFSDEVYEQETLEFLMARLRDFGGGDIVHAGTFFGDFLPALSQACGPEGRVWAFEPNPESYSCASVTMLLNGLGNVELTNAGLGATADTLHILTMDQTGRSLGGSSRIVRKDCDGTGGTSSVKMVTIDDVVPSDRRVVVIQLDVEGHEWEALFGGLKTIQAWLPVLVLEVTKSSTLLESAWFSEHVLELGYRRLGTIDENAVFVPRAN